MIPHMAPILERFEQLTDGEGRYNFVRKNNTIAFENGNTLPSDIADLNGISQPEDNGSIFYDEHTNLCLLADAPYMLKEVGGYGTEERTKTHQLLENLASATGTDIIDMLVGYI